MDILSHFITSKVIFFLAKRPTTLFCDITNKDNVDVTIENYKLEIKENFESVLFTRFDFSIVEQVQASLDAS